MNYVNDTSVARPLQLRGHDDSPAFFAHGLVATLLSQTPNCCEVDSIPRSSASNRSLRLRADDQPTSSTRSNELCCIANEIPPHPTIAHHTLGIAELESLPAFDSFAQHLVLEPERQPLCEV